MSNVGERSSRTCHNELRRKDERRERERAGRAKEPQPEKSECEPRSEEREKKQEKRVIVPLWVEYRWHETCPLDDPGGG